MRARIAVWAAGALFAAIVTCRPTDVARDPSQARRWFDDAALPVAWAADARDVLPADIGALAADDSLVYLLDRERGDVVALDTRSGRRRWRWAAAPAHDAHGAAPMPALGLSLSIRGVVVASRDGGALVELDRRGRAIRSTMLDRPEFLFGVCALARGRALIATARSAALWRIVDPDAAAVTVTPPWPDAASRPAVTWQAALAPLPGYDGCAIALALGAGFAVVSSGGAARAAGYVETIAPPRLVDHRVQVGGRSGTARKLDAPMVGATGAAVHGETLFVAFAGATPDRGRLIDRYLWRSGDYVGSLRLPAPAARIAIGGGRLFTLSELAGGSALHAYERRATRHRSTLVRTLPGNPAPP